MVQFYNAKISLQPDYNMHSIDFKIMMLNLKSFIYLRCGKEKPLLV
jgi:hypothetical protein